MKKKYLAAELEKSKKTIQELIGCCDKLASRCATLERDNTFLNNQMDKAINLIMAKKRAKIGTPSWLKDIINEV